MDGNSASTPGTIIRWERCWQSRTDHFQIYQAKFDLYKSLDQPKKAANVQKLIDCSSFILGEDGRYSELLGFEYERLEDVVSNNCKKLRRVPKRRPDPANNLSYTKYAMNKLMLVQ